MKRPFLSVLLILQLLGPGMAVTVPLPEVPPPALSVAKVLAIARKELGRNPAEVMLVGIDWCQAAKFRPRYSTGGGYPDLEKKPEEYCWFITYLDRKADPTLPADRQKFREITLVSVENGGTARILPFERD